MAITIPKLKFSEPRHNLPGRKGIATAEDRFTIGFARAYSERFTTIHPGSSKSSKALAREIPVNGYGIADLVVIAWEPGLDVQDSIVSFIASSAVTTRAFECKMRDWRSALTQALRYRFFAHQSIVVLPLDACSGPLPYIETFKKTRIGLWGFDANAGRVKVFHTPRPAPPKSEKYSLHAVKMVKRATKKALPIG